MKNILRNLITAAAFAATPLVFSATDAQWAGGTGSFIDTAQWDIEAVPGADNTLVFSTGTGTVSLNSTASVYGISVSSGSGAYTLAPGSGGSLSIGAGGLTLGGERLSLATPR